MIYDYQSEKWVLVQKKGHKLPTKKQRRFLKDRNWIDSGITRKSASIFIASLIDMQNFSGAGGIEPLPDKSVESDQPRLF
jgi:hypothetical protein